MYYKKSEKKFNRTSVASDLPKHVRKGSTRGRAHRAFCGLLIAVPTVIGAWGDAGVQIHFGQECKPIEADDCCNYKLPTKLIHV